MGRLRSPASGGTQALCYVGCVIFAEPFASTLLLPFVYFMVRDMTDDPTLIGFRVGLITSCFFLCQMITGPLWGLFSDSFGRKKAFVIGLLGGAISMVCFGLSKTLAQAVISRSICGVLNGNIGVARTTIAEIAAKYRIQQSRAFSTLGLAGAVGYIAGPLVGGMLSRPAELLGIRGPHDIWVQFPYLLPCLVSAIFNLITMAMVWFGLEETNTTTKAATEEPSSVATEEEALLPHKGLSDRDSEQVAPSTKKFSKDVFVLLLATGLICLHAIMFEEVYSLFAASSLKDGTGLSFQSHNIAISLSVLGPVVIVVQMFVYPILNSKIDTINLWKISAIGHAIDYPLMSLLPLIQDSSVWRWIMLIAILCVRVTVWVLGWTSLNIITNNLVDPSHRGFITSIVQASASLSRALGPTIGGTLWSWSLHNKLEPPFDFHLFFLSISFLAMLQGVTGFWIPKSAASTN